MGYESGILVLDLYKLFDSMWKGVLIAIPIWCTYLIIKIKIIDMLNKRRSEI